MTRRKNRDVTDYWEEFYTSPQQGLCTLCGNIGIIDTRAARTTAGVECGRLNWCICPNGQTMRKLSGAAFPTTLNRR